MGVEEQAGSPHEKSYRAYRTDVEETRYRGRWLPNLKGESR